MTELKKIYCFIDEGGDSSFYASGKKLLVGSGGFQPNLNLGMIMLEDKKGIQDKISNFIDGLKNDPLYNSIHSFKQENWYLHARGDHSEIRSKFFELLRELEGYKSYFVIGRKRLGTFQNKHNSNEREFYFDLIYHLLKDRLREEDCQYQIFLSARKKSTQEHLGAAIGKAIERDNKRRKISKDIKFKFDIVRSEDTLELSIVDYLLWALHRYIVQ